MAKPTWEEDWEQGRPLKPNVLLEPKLFETIGIGPSRIDSVLKKLVENRFETVGNLLLALKTEAKAIEIVEDDISGATLWGFLEEQRTLRAALGSEIKLLSPAAPGAKRLRIVTENTGGTGGFVRRCLVLRTNINFDEPDEVQLGMPLWGEEGRQSFLLRRESTKGVASSLVDEFLSTRRTTILAGSKGIGKSCESIHMIKRLIDLGRVIIFEHGSDTMVIVEEKAFEQFGKELNEILTRLDEPPLTVAGVYDLVDGEYLFRTLCKHAAFVHIVDIGDNYVRALDVEHRKIIISSPNADKIKRTGEVENPKVVYLSVWKEDELRDLNTRLPPPDSGAQLVQHTEEDLEALMAIFGPIPREVFRNRNLEKAEKDILSLVQHVPLDTWRSVLTDSDYTRLPKLVPGVLVNITKHAVHEDWCEVTFASTYVAKLVVRRFYQSQRNELFALAHSVRGMRRLTGQLRGEVLQQRLHEVVETHPCTLQVSLLSNDGFSAPFSLILPQLKVRSFKSNKILDLTSLAENDFCIADSPNFPAVESFMVMRRSVLGLPGSGLCVFGLQSTMAHVHPLKRHGLKLIQNRCCALLNLSVDQLPIYVLFVTTENGVEVAQKMGKRSEQFDATVLQFRCTSVDLNEIMRVFPEEEEVASSDDESR